MADQDDAEILESEVIGLFQYIERLRTEIAQINGRNLDGEAFRTMSDQLDAIVQATEAATDGILEHLEGIGATLDELRAAGIDPALCDRISGHTTSAMEHCTFQDITGQRVTKIVRSLQFVEERVDTMIELLGRDKVDRVSKTLPEEMKSADEKLLDGPQLAGKSISQDEIDSLFE